MPQKNQPDIIRRWKDNPIITLSDLPFPASDICNAGAVKFRGMYFLLITIENLSGQKSLYIAKSKDGLCFEVDEKPFMEPSEDEPYKKYEKISVMNARITPFEGAYFVTYIAARTDDFKSIARIGMISSVDTKGGTLFSEKINGRYARLERPWSGGRIWIYWGGSKVLISPRPGYWDASRVGDAAPPIRLKDGRWLLIYYGIKDTCSGPLFRIGALILDPDDPAKVIARTNIPILSPRKDYERIGDIPNLIFSCGALLEQDRFLLYYGAAKSCICLGTTSIDKIEKECAESKGGF
ncbi:MAG: glycosidase [Deltaproteobacteria bacterium]|nr:glycosidase [Deltaproteobacteria bacterium]